MSEHEQGTDDTQHAAARAEQVLPRGFVPSHLAVPALRDPRGTALAYTAHTLGEIRMAADILAGPVEDEGVRQRLAALVATEAARLQRLTGALAAGALVAALAVAVTVAGFAAPQSAQAMEGPQPDPAPSATYRVVLGAAPARLLVQASAVTPVAPGWFCGSVWTARGMLARSCSIGPVFQIPVTIDPQTWPSGRSFAQVVDDSSDVAVSTIVFDARRASKFGVGTFTDMGRGDLAVRVPVTLYSPSLGRWVGQSRSPVQVQEATRRGWRVRATLTTNPPGLAVGTVHLGGGRHVIRVVRPDGRTVWGTTGRTRIVTITTEPLDIN